GPIGVPQPVARRGVLRVIFQAHAVGELRRRIGKLEPAARHAVFTAVLQAGGLGDFRRVIRLVGRARAARDYREERDRGDVSSHSIARSWLYPYVDPGGGSKALIGGDGPSKRSI